MTKRWLFLVLMLCLTAFPAVADADPLLPITADNAAQIQQVNMLGRGSINSLLWSLDGAQLAVLGANGVWLYDAENWTHPPSRLGDPHYFTSNGDFDPSGRFLATTDYYGWRLWDVEEANMIYTVPTEEIRYSVVAFSPDGTLIATAGHDIMAETIILQLWDAATGEERAYLPFLDSRQDIIESLHFSPDSSTLLVIFANRPTAYHYQVSDLLVEDMSMPRTYHAPEAAGARRGQIGANGEVYLLYLKGLGDSQYQYLLQSTAQNQPSVTTPPGELKVQTSVAFDLRTGLLAAVGVGGQIEVYDVFTGEIRQILPGHPQTSHVIMDPTGRYLVAYSERQILTVWDLETETAQIISDQHMAFAYTVAFHPDNAQIAIGTEQPNAQILLRDLATGAITARIPGHVDGAWVTDIAFQADGRKMATASGIGCCLHLWDLATNALDTQFAGHGRAVGNRGANHLFFAQNDSLLVSSSDDGTVRLWDVATGTQLHTLTHDGRDVTAAAISANGRYLFSITAQNYGLWIWDLAAGKALTDRAQGHPAQHLVMARDGSLLATIQGNSITLWDPNTAHPLRQIDLADTQTVIADAVFSPDASLIATVSPSGKLQIITLDSGAILAEIQTFHWLTTSIDWRADGKMIAITGREGSVHLYGIPAHP
jgi:WD40 repeat protein